MGTMNRCLVLRINRLNVYCPSCHNASRNPKAYPMNRERLGVGELLVWAFQKLANDPFALVWAGLPIFVVMTAFMAWSILLGVGLALFPIWNQAALDLDTHYGFSFWYTPNCYF